MKRPFCGSVFDFVQIGGLNVGDMQADGQGEQIIGVIDGVAAALYRLVVTAHMPADGNRFLAGQADKPFDEEHALFSVAVRELVLDGKIRPLLPGAVYLHVAHFLFVKPGLAQVVEQAADGDAFLGNLHALGFYQLIQPVVNMQAVEAQPAVLRQMIPGGSRRGEKVPLFQPTEQLIGPFAGDSLLKNIAEIFFTAHENLLKNETIPSIAHFFRKGTFFSKNIPPFFPFSSSI